MASVNKVLILGKLGRDPELRYTPQGSAVATLSVATSESWVDKGEKQERTEWHRVVVWGKSAENCQKYLSKGKGVFIEGRLQTRSWDDQKSGDKRYSTEIVAMNVQFLGGGSREDKGGPEIPPPSEEDNYQRYPASDDIPF